MAEVTVRLTRPISITGRIVTGDGEPRAGVPVRAVPERGEDPGLPRTTVSGPDGRFTLDGLASEPHLLFALGNGYASTGLEASAREKPNPLLTVLDPGVNEVGDLAVEAAGTAEVRVRTNAGTPLRGIPVTGFADPDRHALPYVEPCWLLDLTSAATDEQGIARVTSVVPNLRTYFRIEVPGASTVPSEHVTVRSGETVPVEFRVVRRRLDVTVTDADTGGPVAGLWLRAWRGTSPGNSTWADPRYFWTGPDGRCRIDGLPGGRISLSLDHPDYVTETNVQEVPGSEEGGDNLTAVFSLKRGLTITGLRFEGGVATGKVVEADDTRLWVEVFQTRDDRGRPLGAAFVGPLLAGNRQIEIHLPGIHRVFSLLHRVLLTTYQGAVSRKLPAYLEGHEFRFHRRTSKSRGLLFQRLLSAAVTRPPPFHREIPGRPDAKTPLYLAARDNPGPHPPCCPTSDNEERPGECPTLMSRVGNRRYRTQPARNSIEPSFSTPRPALGGGEGRRQPINGRCSQSHQPHWDSDLSERQAPCPNFSWGRAPHRV